VEILIVKPGRRQNNHLAYAVHEQCGATLCTVLQVYINIHNVDVND